MTKEQLEKRFELLKAMDLLARCVNDEEVFEYWLAMGIPDEEIKPHSTPEELEWLCQNEELAQLLNTFMRLMKNALKSGGIYFYDGKEYIDSK